MFFSIGIQGDPVILTFTNPVSAYHALAPFNLWVQGEGSSNGIYDIVGPGAPINQTSGIYGNLNIYTPTGEVGYPSNGKIYENRTTITCKFKKIIGINSQGSQFYTQSRAIIRENKKRLGFTYYEAWMTSVHIEENIPLGFGGNQSTRVYWNPALEAEWL